VAAAVMAQVPLLAQAESAAAAMVVQQQELVLV
jgi:hypothetical protein